MTWGVYITLCIGLACPSPSPVSAKLLTPRGANYDPFWYVLPPSMQRPEPLYTFPPVSRAATSPQPKRILTWTITKPK